MFAIRESEGPNGEDICGFCPTKGSDYGTRHHLDKGLFSLESPIFYLDDQLIPELDPTYNPICKICQKDCGTCQASGNGQCSTCRSPSVLPLEGICRDLSEPLRNEEAELICSDGFYLTDEEVKTCRKCHPTCFTCNGPNSNNCIECNLADPTIVGSTDFVNYRGTCRCPGGFYSEGLESICLACHESCQFCVGDTANDCTKCKNIGWKPFPIPTTDVNGVDQGGACFNCAENMEDNLTQCESQTFKFTFTVDKGSKTASAAQRMDKTNPVPQIPKRSVLLPIIKSKITPRMKEIIEEDPSVLEEFINTRIQGLTEGIQYKKKYIVPADLDEFDVQFEFLEDTGEVDATLSLNNASVFENYTPKSENSRLLQGVDNPNDPVLAAFQNTYTLEGRRSPSKKSTDYVKVTGYTSLYGMALALGMGLLFGLFKTLNIYTNVYELLILGTMFKFITKLPLVNINYGNIMVMFMDIIYELDFQFMFNLVNEADIRPSMSGKFDEYIIPSVAINAACLPIILYFVTFIANVTTLKINNKIGRAIQIVHYSVMSLTLIDVFTYCLIELTQRGPGEGVFHFWILSLILVLMVLGDFAILFLKGRESKFDTENDTIPVQHPYTEFFKHYADRNSYRRHIIALLTNYLVMVKWLILSLIIVVAQTSGKTQAVLMAITQCIFLLLIIVGVVSHSKSIVVTVFRILIEMLFMAYFLFACVFAYDPENNRYTSDETELYQWFAIGILIVAGLLEISLFLYTYLHADKEQTDRKKAYEVVQENKKTTNIEIIEKPMMKKKTINLFSRKNKGAVNKSQPGEANIDEDKSYKVIDDDVEVAANNPSLYKTRTAVSGAGSRGQSDKNLDNKSVSKDIKVDPYKVEAEEESNLGNRSVSVRKFKSASKSSNKNAIEKDDY